MLASLNLLALLTAAILALAFGDRTIRAAATIILLGVLATIFVQRITRAFAPGPLLFMVDLFMLGAFLLICVNTDKRWCWAAFGIQLTIVSMSIIRTLGFADSQTIYLNLVAFAGYLHVAVILYAIFDRYFGSPAEPPGARP